MADFAHFATFMKPAVGFWTIVFSAILTFISLLMWSFFRRNDSRIARDVGRLFLADAARAFCTALMGIAGLYQWSEDAWSIIYILRFIALVAGVVVAIMFARHIVREWRIVWLTIKGIFIKKVR
jgi:uncharacterized membrane protein YoaK (UPF0700 family)